MVVPSRPAGLWLADFGRALRRRVRLLLRFLVTAETGAHRGENLFGKGMFLARAKACKQCRGEDLRRHRLVDGGIDGPAALARILDKPGIGRKRLIFGKRRSGEIKQPGRDHAAAPPYLRDVSNVEIEAMLRRQRLYVGVLQDIESFGIGLHQPVFDAIVNHLDEMSRAHRPGMEITLLDARVAALASRGARNVAEPGRKRREDRVQAIDYLLVAADHHAIAALKSPDPARGADIDIVDAVFLECLAATHVVLPEGVAAIDDDVASLHQLRKRIDGGFGDLAGR